MTSGNDLIAIQNELFSRLQKAERNFKKSPKDRLEQKQYIETRLHNLEDLWLEFKDGHRKLVTLVPEKDKSTFNYFGEDLYEVFEETYITYRTLMKTTLNTFEQPHIGTTNTSREQYEFNAEVKLPRIQIPTFSGKYDEWQSFHDMFVSLINENKTVSEVQKLHYLKASLTGEPEKLIRNFATTEQNYTEAWKQLKKRYDNKRYNVNAVMKTLFCQKQINTESANSVKQLLDTTTSCIKSLKNMGVTTDESDVFIVYIVVSKMDAESHRLWEQQLSLSDNLPSWTQLVDFLEARFRSLEMLDSEKQVKSYATNKSRLVEKTKSFHSAVQESRKTNEVNCLMCNGQHYLYHCSVFEKTPVRERADFVQTKGLCFNCMSPTHVVHKCRLPSCCRKCGRRHHTMLHFDKEGGTESITKAGGHTQTNKNEKEKQSSTINETRVIANFAKGEMQNYNVLLATAVVKASSGNGRKYIVRTLLDQGSQASFITESTAQLLGLKRVPVNGVVSGLGDGQTRIKHVVALQVEARHNPELSFQVHAYVLGTLTSMLPSHKLISNDSIELKSLLLADPGYASPGKIDILLGAEVYSEILLSGMIKNSEGNLIAQNTVFGWVLSGKMSRQPTSIDKKFISMHVQVRENDWLKQFWAIEAEPNSIQKRLTKEELRCEELYEKTTVRNNDGRYIVRLPFKTEDPQCLQGESRCIARSKLLYLEKRLTKNLNLRRDYEKVMEEYLTLQHMALTEVGIDDPKAVYLPHHAVVREDKETTKVRVVFNASCPNNNGVSLNDDLLVGPKLQQDLRHLLMRWRIFPICIVADLVKMYRQIFVHEEDTNFQRVLWRQNLKAPIQHYKLLTLTFGTACAPYLAVKTLQRLTEYEKCKFPVVSEIAKRDFYMDDLMTGCETETEAIHIYEEMKKLMKSGGFQLQKWSSNNKKLLQYIGDHEHNTEQSVPIKSDNMKVLGICWNKTADQFEYTITLPNVNEPITKRKVLADIARLYDPLGWIAPVVICAKVIIQKVWKASLDWDDHLTQELLTEWLIFRTELENVKNIKIPRWLNCKRDNRIELHAFSDASRVGYAGAVYIRVLDTHGKYHVSLVSAKTKVAPIIKELSIPRLELCGAVLAAKLLSEISQVMDIPKDNLFAWTDSTVVLAWLKGGASRWVTFVSNRVSDILSILDYEQWGHVSSENNPADCASRGLRPTELLNHSLWWNGPEWLLEPIAEMEKEEIPETYEEERVTTMSIVTKSEEDLEWTKFSKMSKMLRVISYCRRLLTWKQRKQDKNKTPHYVTSDEIQETLKICIRQTQEIEFGQERKQLKKENCVSKKGVLHTLCPILDKDGIIRVGGRIDQAHANYDMRHPIILPAKSHLTKLVIEDAHERTLHGGPQIMLNYLRAKYWIIRAREQVKKHYRKCNICLRHSKVARTQLMGQLPEVRLKPSKPFRSSGVDYAGPINIRCSPGRGAKSYKGYICLFVCMVTRAIHIEAVSDLSAKGFIAAFKRFTSRRGQCRDLYSDNGTNFVGADKQLREMFDRAKSKVPDEIAQCLTLVGTRWHFIPPQAPNFGGLWEAGVRSAKTHLRKVIGESTLTYEELTTLLLQVEACLNSRPISVLSDSPDDPLPLTPGHFLVGEPLVNVVDEDFFDCNLTRLDRWNLTQKMLNDFWKRWSKEYLVGLSQRYKWTTKYPEPNVGDIVIMKEDNVPPCKWMLGQIVDKHVGPDNVTRVVSVRTKQSIFKRPLSKICVLQK